MAKAQAKGDSTMAAIQMPKILREEQKQDQPEIYGRGMRRRMEELRRRRGR